jgi:hypothetical protein
MIQIVLTAALHVRVVDSITASSIVVLDSAKRSTEMVSFDAVSVNFNVLI